MDEKYNLREEKGFLSYIGKSSIGKGLMTGIATLVFGFNGLIIGCASAPPSLPDPSAAKVIRPSELETEIEKDHGYHVYTTKVDKDKNAYLLDRDNDLITFYPDNCWEKVEDHNLTGHYVANFLNNGGGNLLVTETFCYNPQGHQDLFNGAVILPKRYHIPKKGLERRGSKVFIPCPEKKPFPKISEPRGGDRDGPGPGPGPGGVSGGRDGSTR